MPDDIAIAAERDVDESRDRSGRVAVGLARHGIPGLREQAAPSEGARYGRMFDLDQDELEAHELDPDTLEALADAMIARPGTFDPNPRIPAGYTYFGQFVDHDLTFDPTSTLGLRNDPETLFDFRTPRFDLDSLYGSGPMDQPFLYDWSPQGHRGVDLLVGRNPEGREFTARDLPRNQQGRALIGDARNDENLVTSQLHLLFIRFHNRVVEHVLDGDHHITSPALFEKAQRLVRWHYQWIVKHDFLPRIVGEELANAKPVHFTWKPGEGPFMPVEFSVGAYRFGHSMVRNDYKLNGARPNVPILEPRSPFGPTLAGFRRLPAGFEIEWKHFFPLDTATVAQRSMRIDPSLSRQLAALPPDAASLPFLNLRRANALGLPNGFQAADAMKLPRLDDGDVLAPLPEDVDDRVKHAVVERPPLWYYVLCEASAHADGFRLGQTGGRIVAEVINGLLAADPNSYVRVEPAWTPTFAEPKSRSFTMADLVRFTLGPPPG
jgi:Animal haem peroxidase